MGFKSGTEAGYWVWDDARGGIQALIGRQYSPSTDWAQGGPLIKKYRVDLDHYDTVHATCRYQAGCGPQVMADDELVAVCRAVVAMLLGETIQVPALLVN
jgi:hypothetical protein